MNSDAQEEKMKGPHGGEITPMDGIQTEMTKATNLENETKE